MITPAESTSEQRAKLLAAYDEQVRTASGRQPPEGWSCTWDGPILRCTTPFRGFVGYRDLAGLEGTALDALIARTRDFFAERGEAVEWKAHGHDEPADLTERLRAAGFVPGERETVVIGVAEQIGAAPALPDGVTLRRVTTQADLERIAEMESEIWSADWSWLVADLMGRQAADPDGIVILAAEADGQLVSAAWLVFTPGIAFAGLWGGSTLAAWRGRGIYRALVARRAQLAVERGVRYLQVDASDESLPILERLGFVAITTTTPWVWTPPPGTSA